MMVRCGTDMKNKACVCLDCWNFSEGFMHFTHRKYYYCLSFDSKKAFPKSRQWKDKGLPNVSKCPAFVGSPNNTIIARG